MAFFFEIEVEDNDVVLDRDFSTYFTRIIQNSDFHIKKFNEAPNLEVFSLVHNYLMLISRIENC